MVIRMTIGGSMLLVLGVQHDGLVELPWSIGDAKKLHAIKHLAAAGYERRAGAR